MDFLNDIQNVTADWLTKRLRANGYLNEGTVKDFEVIEQPHPHRSVYRLNINYSPEVPEGTPEEIIFKVNTKSAGHAFVDGRSCIVSRCQGGFSEDSGE